MPGFSKTIIFVMMIFFTMPTLTKASLPTSPCFVKGDWYENCDPLDRPVQKQTGDKDILLPRISDCCSRAADQSRLPSVCSRVLCASPPGFDVLRR